MIPRLHVLAHLAERGRAVIAQFRRAGRRDDMRYRWPAQQDALLAWHALGVLNLDDFCATVKTASAHWDAAGARWSIHRSPLDGRNKHGVWVTIEHRDLAGQLTVWDSGEAELDVGGLDEPVSMTHFEGLENADGPLAELASRVIDPRRR